MQSGEAVPAGRIGPNAILRVMDALRAEQGAPVLGMVLERAGISGYLDAPPEAMVDQGEVRALHSALREILGIDGARSIGRDAGRRTGDYLLAHRIPRFAQRILRALPAPIAGRLLLKAITKNAWTFAGTARFTVAPGRVHRLTLAGRQQRDPALRLLRRRLRASLSDPGRSKGRGHRDRVPGPGSPGMRVRDLAQTFLTEQAWGRAIARLQVDQPEPSVAHVRGALDAKA